MSLEDGILFGVSPEAKSMRVSEFNGEEKHHFDPQNSPSYTYNTTGATPRMVGIYSGAGTQCYLNCLNRCSKSFIIKA